MGKHVGAGFTPARPTRAGVNPAPMGYRCFSYFV